MFASHSPSRDGRSSERRMASNPRRMQSIRPCEARGIDGEHGSGGGVAEIIELG
jgi:hypothetical protein